MQDRHHYDAHGNYQGYTSDKAPFAWGAVVVIGIIVLVLLNSGKDSTNHLPRPTNDSLMQWLLGQQIVVPNGVWTIQAGEIRDFRVLNVTRNQTTNIYAATVAFDVVAGGIGLRVQGTIHYKDGAQGLLYFAGFQATSYTKLGAW
jgi:hypothetical protein